MLALIEIVGMELLATVILLTLAPIPENISGQ
jgi:hypothetical protein